MSRRRYSYTGGDAERYGSLGIEGTTYQIGFDAVAKLLGDITGRTFLDFGCGTGRSARFLKQLGARHVYGADHDQNMIDQARDPAAWSTDEASVPPCIVIEARKLA